MKRFNFELESYLKLLENREQEAELVLGKAVGILFALEQRIKKVAQEKIQAVEDRFSGKKGLHQIQSYELYILRLDQTRDALLQAAARAQLEVEKARELYLEASKKRKVISNLKEQQEKEYRRIMNLEEIKIIDDISGGVAARKIAAGL